MRKGLRLRVVCAVSGALVAAGCDGGDSSAADVADGRHFGYLKSVDTSSTPATVQVDVAEFLSGEEANVAAVEDGVIARVTTFRTTTTSVTRTRRSSPSTWHPTCA